MLFDIGCNDFGPLINIGYNYGNLTPLIKFAQTTKGSMSNSEIVVDLLIIGITNDTIIVD